VKKNRKQKAERLLASVSLRCTRPRIAILNVLLGAERPITQEEVAFKLGSSGPNKVTIYRILEALVEADLVHKVFMSERTWHFELADNCTESQCHPHFTCTECSDTHCLPEISVPMAKSPYKGFNIRHQRVQLEGLCPKCNPNL
jgi:Fur family ferric uptake transcriptional regulator